MIQAEIHLTPADYRSYIKSFQKYIRQKARPLLGGVWSNMAIWGVLVFLFVLIFQRWNKFDVETAFFVGAIAIAFIGLFIFELLKLNRASFPEPDSWYYKPMSFQFDESGIQCRTVVGNSTTKWEGVQDIVRNNGLILIFIESSQAFVLPEVQLDDADQLVAQIQQWSGINLKSG